VDKRLGRFVQRYIDSPLKLEIVRTVAHHPNHLYSFTELAAFTESPPAEVEQAVFGLEHLGLVSTKRKHDGILTGLSRSPVVREMAVKLFRYASNPGGHAKLVKIAKTRR
jgi:DNA-binding transcriptional regulator YhcF (GntR family)